MHILLINKNPVVSRLLVLCTRDDTVHLEEVSHFNMSECAEYSVIFVDEDAQDIGLDGALSVLDCDLKVFISYEGAAMPGFDVTIKKPFLPSQIIALIDEAKEQEEAEVAKPFIFPLSKAEEADGEENENEEESVEEEVNEVEDVEKHLVEEVTHLFEISETSEDEIVEDKIPEEELNEEVFQDVLETETLNVLDADEIEKIKALLEMDEDLDVQDEETVLSDEEIEVRKVEVIKEQLLADGLEIVEEIEMLDKIVEELSVNLDGKLEQTKSKKDKSKKKSKKLKFTEENMEHIEDAIEMAMASMTKKQMKKLLKGKEVDITVKLEGQN